MHFRNYDGLKLFSRIAEYPSFSVAGDRIGLTKGAISYQIKTLEDQLGFDLFRRLPAGVELTSQGKQLWHTLQVHFGAVNDAITELQNSDRNELNVVLSTYFASRWLSSRLMDFMRRHPDIRIKLEPAIAPAEFEQMNADMAIRWGQGKWTKTVNEFLFESRSKPVASPELKVQSNHIGLKAFFKSAVLLHDTEESVAWKHWFKLNGFRDTNNADNLVIKDPNVRVDAVINGQGVALYDQLVEREIDQGMLEVISSEPIHGYGYYLCYAKASINKPAVKIFRDWLLEQSASK